MSYLLRELLAVDSIRTLQFFLDVLQEEKLPSGIEEPDLMYVASVLSHYSITSSGDRKHTPLMSSLSEIMDEFLIPVAYSGVSVSSEVLEVAGAQTLMLNGFFRSQMRQRHNLSFFDRIGKTFFFSAGFFSHDSKKKEVLPRVAKNFTEWALVLNRVNQKALDRRYLIVS